MKFCSERVTMPMLFLLHSPGEQQRGRVSAVFGKAEGVPGSAGKPGAQRPGAVLARERAV